MTTLFSKKGREWLNNIHSIDTGSVQWSVEVNRYSDNIASSMDIGSCLSIRDCSRKITLDFSSFEEEDFKERVDKLNILRDQLDKMYDSLQEAYMLCKDEWERKKSED